MPQSPKPGARANPERPSPKTLALIVAAGRGTRAKRHDEDGPKQYRRLDGESVLNRTIRQFTSHPAVDAVCVLIHADDETLYLESVTAHEKLLSPVIGGVTRQESVYNGLRAFLGNQPEHVLIHDGVRPFISHAIISANLEALESTESALTAIAITDTIKDVDESGLIKGTIPRERLWAAQTPQSFAFPAIYKAHELAAFEGRNNFTDDTSLAEWQGLPTTIVAGSRANIKLTMPEDFPDFDTDREQKMTRETRIGNGYDVHAFEEGDAVILCGLPIPHDRKLKGHSDADVALHALTDAVLGAIGDGDIGMHFPPSDPQWKGATSDQFLVHALDRVAALDGRVINLDVTIVCEAPKIGPHREALRASIARITGLDARRISVKATTSERLGFTGRKEGIAALASASIELPALP